ncbi:MAG: hypothetical protein WCG55_02860 [bacterium]
MERLRAREGIDANVPMTYAGRLDPAAEGELIILVGDECKNKDAYSGLSKTYVAEILFGVSTDTYDLLGLPKLSEALSKSSFKKATRRACSRASFSAPSACERPSLKEDLLSAYLDSRIGKQMQMYPAYSSKTVGGVQLHAHARAGKDVDLPIHEVELIAYADLTVGLRTRAEVIDRVRDLTSIVKGDFRQTEILESWTSLVTELPEELLAVKVHLTVSSGFYIRQFAHDIGEVFGADTCLYSLVRNHIEQ